MGIQVYLVIGAVAVVLCILMYYAVRASGENVQKVDDATKSADIAKNELSAQVDSPRTDGELDQQLRSDKF